MKKQKITFTWLTPANIVTYFGMILVLVSYYYFIYVKDNIIGVVLFIIAALTDWLDGFVARNGKIQKFFHGRGVSKQGKMLDPLRDTMLRLSIFILAIISNISLWFPAILP